MNHNERRDQIGQQIRSKGFWDDGTGKLDGVLFRLSLCQTEACEAMQEVKRYWGKETCDQEMVKNAIAEELADYAIRVYDVAAFGGFDLETGNELYDVVKVGPNNRAQLIIQIGKLTALIGDTFALVEEDVLSEESGLTEFTLSQGADFLYTAIKHSEYICKSIGRDLYAAIDAKMAVNMKRPQKYGTPDEAKV